MHRNEMSAIFLSSWGICIQLSVLQRSHWPAPCSRAKSWLKVQSLVEQHDSNTILSSVILHHIFAMIIYDWIIHLRRCLWRLIDIEFNSLLSAFLRWANCDFKTRCVRDWWISVAFSCQTDVVPLLLTEKCLQCPAWDIWHPDVCHYSFWEGFQ